jgi:light-regulated signal transduction histidine kinase (bacteriophytochrome)
MEQMGGHITVESQVGQGTTFILHLPVWRNEGCNKRNIEERDDGKTVVGR